MPSPVNPKSHHIDILAGGRLRPGAVVSARVVDDLGGGRYRLLWDGRSLKARSALRLKPGMLIRARVIEEGSSIRLRLIAQDLASTDRSAAGTPPSPSTLLDAALLRAGLPLPADVERTRLAALLGRTAKRDARTARLYAELLSKGADPAAGFLEALDALLFEDPRRDRRGRGGGGYRWPNPPSGEELAEALSKDDGEPDAVWDLLSRVPGRDGRWMFRRTTIRIGSDEAGVVWKIRDGAVPAVALTVHDAGRTLEFLLEGRSPVRMSVYADPVNAVGTDAWTEFRETLSLLNISVSDTISSISESDGFTADAGKTIRDLEGLS